MRKTTPAAKCAGGVAVVVDRVSSLGIWLAGADAGLFFQQDYLSLKLDHPGA